MNDDAFRQPDRQVPPSYRNGQKTMTPDDPRLTAFILGELSDAESARVATAIEGSAELQSAVNELRETVAILENAATEIAPRDAKFGITAAQQAEIESALRGGNEQGASNHRTSRSVGSSLRPIASFAIAATLVVVLGSLAFVLTRPEKEIDPVALGPSVRGPEEKNQADNLATGDVQSSADGVTRELAREEDEGLELATEAEPSDGIETDFQRPTVEFEARTEELSEQFRKRSAAADQSGGNRRFFFSPNVRNDPYETTTAPVELQGNAPETPQQLLYGVDPAYDPSSLPTINETEFARGGEEQGGQAQAGSDGEVRGREAGFAYGGYGGALGFDAADTMGPTEPMYEYAEGYAIPSDAEEMSRLAMGDSVAETPVEGRLGQADRAMSAARPARPATVDATAVPADARDLLENTREDQKSELSSAESSEPSTWRPATASANAVRLSVGHHDDLPLSARDTYVRIDGFRARVLLDCYYYNDRANQLEGQFHLRLPDDAALHYFAFGPTSLQHVPGSRGLLEREAADRARAGQQDPAPQKQRGPHTAVVTQLRRQMAASEAADLSRRALDPEFRAAQSTLFHGVKAARVVPRQKAAQAYEETVRRRVDPALVEWAGPGIFQTRVYPLQPQTLHRIVIGYDIDLKSTEDGLHYQLDLPPEVDGDVEFDVAATAGTRVSVTPDREPFVSGSRAYYRFEDVSEQPFTITLEQSQPIMLTSSTETSDFFALRSTPNLPAGEIEDQADTAIFLLDTSFSDKPAQFDRWLRLLDQILKQNDSIKRFNVMMFGIDQHWWRESPVVNSQQNRTRLLNECQQLVLEGATNLHAALQATVRAAEDNDGPVSLFLLSDGAATWGPTDFASLREPAVKLQQASQANTIFAYQLEGFPSDRVVLETITQATGGALFSVATGDDLQRAATAHRSLPWQLIETQAKGVDDILVGGNRTVYANQELLITGRGKPEGPIELRFRRGETEKTVQIEPSTEVKSPLTSRLYGGEAVARLEPLTGELEDVAIAFARHFRVPGRTCSLVMLESEADYNRFNIDAGKDPLLIQASQVQQIVENAEQERRVARRSAKQQFIAWMEKWESQDLALFRPSNALKMAIRGMDDEAFVLHPGSLAGTLRTWKDVSDGYRQQLGRDDPDFDAVMEEAERRYEKQGVADALHAASTAVEARAGDPEILRAVAFAAIDWQRSDQAAHLLWRVADARPYQPQALLLLARCFEEAGKADAAIVCYELVVSGNWNNRWASCPSIASFELHRLLKRIESGELETSAPAYAASRRKQLVPMLYAAEAKMAVLIFWNTDRTDVDLHIHQPDGEVCFFRNQQTRIGGRLSADITEGLGPELFVLPDPKPGTYRVTTKYFRGDDNRSNTPTSVLVTTLDRSGKADRQTTARVRLNQKGDETEIATIKVGSES